MLIIAASHFPIVWGGVCLCPSAFMSSLSPNLLGPWAFYAKALWLFLLYRITSYIPIPPPPTRFPS